MPLRFAGEDTTLILGRDTAGWLREIKVNDANPGLDVKQQGSGPAMKIDNSKFIVGRNAANTGNINLLKVNAGDEFEVGATLNMGNFQLLMEGVSALRRVGTVLRIVDSGNFSEVDIRPGAVSSLRVQNAKVGFYGTLPAAQQTVTGSRGGNAALASLLTALAATGLIVDSTTA